MKLSELIRKAVARGLEVNRNKGSYRKEHDYDSKNPCLCVLGAAYFVYTNDLPDYESGTHGWERDTVWNTLQKGCDLPGHNAQFPVIDGSGTVIFPIMVSNWNDDGMAWGEIAALLEGAGY